ncbi:MAG: ROK family transcriptional regulator [Spirochaetaceae bacterium]|jgi:predicted NBD/HSP70 family sugar kinase|nr:ROK family transcriptional regulator [Spirochaetaceae bacterium]
MKSVQTLKDVRLINRNKILRNIYFSGPLSRLEICDFTGLSPATVGNLVNPLIDEGVIHEVGFEESNGGRRRVILESNKDYGYFLGVDIGRTYVQVDLFDFCMNLKTSEKRVFPLEQNSLEHLKQSVVSLSKNLFTKFQIEEQKILGIGMALPGFVDNDTGELFWCPVKEWEGQNIIDLFFDSFNAPLAVDNGSKAMAIAERWFGCGQNAMDMVVLILGRGIGSGIVTDGSLIRGNQNFAGEWGHSILKFNIESSNKTTTLSIENAVNEKLDHLWKIKGMAESIDPSDELEILSRLLLEEDSEAKAIIMDIAKILAVGVANLLNLFNPKLLIFGGWMGVGLYKYLEPHIKEELEELVFPPLLKCLDFSPSKFGSGDSCIGAACLALNKYFLIS